MDDPYEVLGLKHGATTAQIKARYRQLAKMHHPDKNRGDPTAEWVFKRIQAAYDVLQREPKPAPARPEQPRPRAPARPRRETAEPKPDEPIDGVDAEHPLSTALAYSLGVPSAVVVIFSMERAHFPDLVLVWLLFFGMVACGMRWPAAPRDWLFWFGVLALVVYAYVVGW